MNEFAGLAADAGRYYADKFEQHGATAAGVDWRDEESQILRFRQLLKVVTEGEPAMVLDWGCGYGALAGHLQTERPDLGYVGYDVSPTLVEHARRIHPDRLFVDAEDDLPEADYVIASGVFNVKLDTTPEIWRAYVLDTIGRMHRRSRRGLAFNMLTSYSDPERMRDDLYYGDPTFFFDHAKRALSRNVALLHDYGLWEFTLLVRFERP